jgi:hypothetical protein
MPFIPGVARVSSPNPTKRRNKKSKGTVFTPPRLLLASG